MAMVYLIPAPLQEEAGEELPAYLLPAIKECQVFFVENERSTRRYFKQLWKEMVIDAYQWVPIHKAEEETRALFSQLLRDGKNIGIVSEAGCPGIADPGQLLVAVAQEMNVTVKPLVGPSSLLLALMASGMNGQQFRFVGYLPIDNAQRVKAIKDLEAVSAREDSTQLFIETPYRNNQLLETLVRTCKASTRLCIAVDLTGKEEWIKTKTMAEWLDQQPDIHKRPAIFLLYSGK